MNRVFQSASVVASSVRVYEGKREFVRVDLRGRMDLSVDPVVQGFLTLMA